MPNRLIFAIFILISVVSVAQEGTTSPYSFYGIGSITFKGTMENRAMGGISVLSDSIHINLQNPAAIADLRLVNFSIGGSHKFSNLKSADESQNATTTTLGYMALGIPMGKFGASFGVLPYTSVGYKIESLGDGNKTQYTGEGGMNKAFFNLGYKVTPKLNVGVDVNYNFGRIENVAFFRQEELQYGTREFEKSDLHGVSVNIGASYRTMISEILEIITVISYSPETDLTSENSREIGTILETPLGGQAIIDLRMIDVEDTDFTFPSQLTIGAGIGQPKKWSLGAEYTNQKTSNFANRNFDIENVEFKDSSKFRLGGYFVPRYNSIRNYWHRSTYRIGVRYEETGINVNGQDINEFGISFGVGLPVGRLFSNVNIGFEFGKRGNDKSGLVEENFFNTFLSLSLNDRWFEKRYYD